MPTHIWVLESYFGSEWRFHSAFFSRADARHWQREFFFAKRSRIRKYVPA